MFNNGWKLWSVQFLSTGNKRFFKKSSKGWKQDTEIKTDWRTQLGTASTSTQQPLFFFWRSKRKWESKFTYCHHHNLLLERSLHSPFSYHSRFCFIMLFFHKEEVGLCTTICHSPWQSLTIQAEGSEIVKNTFSVLSALPVRLLKGVLTECTKGLISLSLSLSFLAVTDADLLQENFFFLFHLFLFFSLFPWRPLADLTGYQ